MAQMLVVMCALGIVTAFAGVALAVVVGPWWLVLSALGVIGALASGFLAIRSRVRQVLMVLEARHASVKSRLESALQEQECSRQELTRMAQAEADLGERVSADGARFLTRILMTERSSRDLAESLRVEFAASVDTRMAELEALAEGRLAQIEAAGERSQSRAELLATATDDAVQKLSERLDTSIDGLVERNKELYGSLARFRETYQQARTDLRRVDQSAEAELTKIRRQLSHHQKDVVSLAAELLRSPSHVGGSMASTASWALRVLRHHIRSDAPHEVLLILHRFPVLLRDLSLAEVRAVARSARQLGFSEMAIGAQEMAATMTGSEADRRTLELWRDERLVETSNFRDFVPDDIEPLIERDARTVVHVVGHCLPLTQSGYTVRTHEISKAQLAVGLTPIVVNQGGVYDEVASYVLDGVEHRLLDTPPRRGMLRSEWIKANIAALIGICEEVRPSTLHAHSDYLNAMIAIGAGEALGIPVVYEQRGFWEESWWSRNVEQDAERQAIFEMLPLPDVYTSRGKQEAQARALATKVTTLAEVMVNHANEQSELLGYRSREIQVVPNAVDAERFAHSQHNPELAEHLGIRGPVIGYISSMVPYEGIDVLGQAFLSLRELVRHAREATADELTARVVELLGVEPGPALDVVPQLRDLASASDPELLLVGEGVSADELAGQVGDDPGIHFTGKVPNEEVVDFYGLIDVFVVPRKPFKVCELVTPLKPVEAMAAGRAMIMSDVLVLRELAHESAAAVTFRAGDPKDLCLQLILLLTNDETRRDLGRRGRSWVSEHRSWAGNAEIYRSLYGHLYDDLDVSQLTIDEAAEAAVSRHDLLTQALVGLKERQPRRGTGWFAVEAPRAAAADVMRNGWRTPSGATVKLSSIDWEEACRDNRTDTYLLQSWAMLQPAMAEFGETHDPVLLDWCLSVAEQWARYYADEVPDDSMAYYDMALAIRVGRLSRLVYWAAQHGRLRQARGLTETLLREARALGAEKAFNPRNNHGFFTAAADLEYALLFKGALPIEESYRRGTERMRIMVESQFAADGGHKEHSPAYHLMLLSSFNAAIEDGLIEDQHLLEVLRRAAYALGWFSLADGTLAQFGDTESKPVAAPRLGSINSPETLFQMTRGKRGNPDTQEVFALPEAGFAFVRSPQPQQPEDFEHQNYLALSAAFHSRAHKHADDLSIIWTHRGQEILVDSGRFGYLDLLPHDAPERLRGFYYSRPERQYVESTMAHNTVSIDGQDVERRLRKPYGSGITSAERLSDGSFVLTAVAPHDGYSHRRKLVLAAGEGLEIVDELQCDDDREHATLWLNLDGSLDVEESAGGLTLTIPSLGEALILNSSAALVDVVRGQESPLRGWRSRRDRVLEPVWSVAFRTPITSTSLSVRTVFRRSEH